MKKEDVFGTPGEMGKFVRVVDTGDELILNTRLVLNKEFINSLDFLDMIEFIFNRIDIDVNSIEWNKNDKN